LGIVLRAVIMDIFMSAAALSQLRGVCGWGFGLWAFGGSGTRGRVEVSATIKVPLFGLYTCAFVLVGC